MWVVGSSAACDDGNSMPPTGSASYGGSGAGTAAAGSDAPSGTGGQYSGNGGVAGAGGTIAGQAATCSGGCVHTLGTEGRIDGNGFESDEGRLVRAVVRSLLPPKELSAHITQGSFSFSWDTHAPAGTCGGCSVTGNDSPYVLIFVDRNDNGSCERDSDLFFVREASSFSPLVATLTPVDEPCPATTSTFALTSLAADCDGLPTTCAVDAAGGAGGAGGDTAVGGDAAAGAGGAP